MNAQISEKWLYLENTIGLDSVKIIVVAEMYTTHMFKESAKRILNI
jgi:hypothetical protein